MGQNLCLAKKMLCWIKSAGKFKCHSKKPNIISKWILFYWPWNRFYHNSVQCRIQNHRMSNNPIIRPISNKCKWWKWWKLWANRRTWTIWKFLNESFIRFLKNRYRISFSKTLLMNAYLCEPHCHQNCTKVRFLDFMSMFESDSLRYVTWLMSHLLNATVWWNMNFIRFFYKNHKYFLKNNKYTFLNFFQKLTLRVHYRSRKC